MTKKKLLSCAALTAGLLAFAYVCLGSPTSYKVEFSTIATNSATSGIVTNSSPPLTAYIDAIIVDLSGTSTNVDLDVWTKAAAGSGPARQIISTNDITADVVLYPRIPTVHTIAGTPQTALTRVRVPLVTDTIQTWMQAETTGVTAQVWIILSPVP